MKQLRMKQTNKKLFLSMLSGTKCASFLGNMVAGKEAIAASQGKGINRGGDGSIATRQGWEI